MDDNTKQVCQNLISMRNSRIQSEKVIELTGKYERWLRSQANLWKEKAEQAYEQEYFHVAYNYEKLAAEIEEVLNAEN